MSVEERTISPVLHHGMCTGCGFCASLCPVEAIHMSENSATGLIQPVVDKETCVACGQCRRVCPPLNWPDCIGYGVCHANLGPVQSVNAVHSACPILRREASSGGFVTSAIIHLLEVGRVTGALLATRKRDNPLRNELRLVRTAEEARKCMGSKYSPISFDTVYPMIGQLSEDERLAVVGLPCHIQGLSMAANLNSRLARIVTHKISLVCGGAPSFHAYDYICRKLGIQQNHIAEFHNRGNGWPGTMRIVLKGEPRKEIQLPYRSPLSMRMTLSSPVFRPQACQLCADPLGFFSDVAVSDAWLPQYIQRNDDGWNLVVAKTQAGKRLVDEMTNSGQLTSEPSSIDEFIMANQRVFNTKLESRSYGLEYVLGKECAQPYRNRTAIDKRSPLGALAKLKIFFYYKQLKYFKLLQLSRAPFLLMGVILRYMKLSSLLK